MTFSLPQLICRRVCRVRGWLRRRTDAVALVGGSPEGVAMMFWAQVALLALAVIAFVIAVETLLTDSAMAALSKTLRFNLPPARTAAPCRTATLTGNESDDPIGSAGDHLQK